MLDVELNDTCSPALAGLPERLHAALVAKAGALAAELQAKVQQKLSGGVLNARSGALARSIVMTMDNSPTNVSVRIAASADVKYAAIHEFGGTIPPHQIVPDKAKALAFIVGGKLAFAARVQIPAVTMPERSYMRSSLAEMADAIEDDLEGAAGEELK